jgi:hypothetical protein
MTWYLVLQQRSVATLQSKKSIDDNVNKSIENKGCSTTRNGNWQFNGDFTGTVKQLSINQKG